MNLYYVTLRGLTGIAKDLGDTAGCYIAAEDESQAMRNTLDHFYATRGGDGVVLTNDPKTSTVELVRENWNPEKPWHLPNRA